jgi:hypothetical protein
MTNESELFILVVIIIITGIMHVVLAKKGPGPNDGKK